MDVLDLFSGIGGFSIGLERAGFRTAAFCEIEEYPQRVLRRHWPEVPIYNDVRTVTLERLKNDGLGSIRFICGGFPCQDISTAGEGKGIAEGTRSGLWSECARLVGEIRPEYALFENVTNLLNGGGGAWFRRVLWDIAALGYDAIWHCIPASDLGAHHHRDRIWILAYPNETSGKGGRLSQRIHAELALTYGRSPDWAARHTMADPCIERQPHPGASQIEFHPPEAGEGQAGWTLDGRIGDLWQAEPALGRVVDGLSDALDADGSVIRRPFKKGDGGLRSRRLGTLGNAVVPQIPEVFGRAIMKEEHSCTEKEI